MHNGPQFQPNLCLWPWLRFRYSECLFEIVSWIHKYRINLLWYVKLFSDFSSIVCIVENITSLLKETQTFHYICIAAVRCASYAFNCTEVYYWVKDEVEPNFKVSSNIPFNYWSMLLTVGEETSMQELGV